MNAHGTCGLAWRHFKECVNAGLYDQAAASRAVLARIYQQRFGLVQLPGQLDHLSNGWVIGVAAGMYVVEFIADKIPYVDSAWDAVHTFIRPPAAVRPAVSCS